MIRSALVLSLTLFVLLAFDATAQEGATCPAIVQNALNALDEMCSSTGRNQACYGNVTLVAEPQVGSIDFEFNSPGDIENVADISTLRLSALDEVSQEWGVSLLRVQANLPDTLPGQNVTMLLFGDVEITNAIPPGDNHTFKPMQAFYFRSGVGDAPCTEAPDSGILIQTPGGTEKVQLAVNGVNLWLGSTAFLQAQPGSEMVISVVEGAAVVEALGTVRTVPAGSRVRVPLADNLSPSAPPSQVEPYDLADLQALPVPALPRQVKVQSPLIFETEAIQRRGQTITLEVFECAAWPPIRTGQFVTFQHGIGFARNREEAERQREGQSVAIVVDNFSPIVYYEGITFHNTSGLYGDRALADWIATRGTHTVTSVWTHPNEPMDTCTFTVK